MTTLMSKWKNLSVEEIAVATVMSHIAQFDSRIQRMSFTHDICNRHRLQQELKAVSYMKHKTTAHASDNATEAKRSRETPVKCYNCGKIGHKTVQCRYRWEALSPNSRAASSSSHQRSASQSRSVPAKPPLTCYHCHGVGHYASDCPKRRGQDGNGTSSSKGVGDSQPSHKQVNVCTVSAPAGSLRHAGEQYQFSYDSGAECSLIKESLASKFSGKRFHNVVTMTGIGQTSVNSTEQILTTVDIDSITLQILFHVLPDSYLRYDIMVGRELLGQGLSVYMTANKLQFVRATIVNVCDFANISTIDFDCVDTDVPPEHKSELVNILNTYKQYFTNGIPTTRADVTPMQIRLKDPL